MKLISSLSRGTLAAFLVAGLAVSADAQGKSKGPDKKPDKPAVAVAASNKSDKAVKAAVKADDKHDKAVAKAARKVSPSQAVVVTREVLLSNGYQIVRVTPVGTTQVIYFRRGNMGNGRGLGPVQKIVVVPAGEIVRFQSVPEPLLATILRRLGL